jgi:hypothetical protein
MQQAMQIRVITLGNSSALVEKLKSWFPESDVRIQAGIDLRRTPTDILFDSNMITHSVIHTLKHGRRWHHEVPSKGAVGIAQANRLALGENTDEPLLLLEEDCMISKPEKFKREVAHLLSHADKFDLATFGCKYRGGAQSASWLPDGFSILRDQFWLLHCVLYTPSGRAKVTRLLGGPLEMQIDSLYGSEAGMRRLTVVGQLKNWSAIQSYHPSHIQISQSNKGRSLALALVLVLCFGMCTYKGWYRRSPLTGRTPESQLAPEDPFHIKGRKKVPT